MRGKRWETLGHRLIRRTAQYHHRRVLRRVVRQPLAVHSLSLGGVLGLQHVQPRTGLVGKGEDALRGVIVIAVVAQSVGRCQQRHRGLPHVALSQPRRIIIIAATRSQRQHAAYQNEIKPLSLHKFLH
ncbi:MAG: hypothetical protein K6G92_08880 [Bacteroidaceae bacterium]|nr:hypothetical protein [Bacteroidaceae bacterium]